MNSWLESEAQDEVTDRALFARRARALSTPKLPSLDAILAAAAAPSSSPSQSRAAEPYVSEAFGGSEASDASDASDASEARAASAAHAGRGTHTARAGHPAPANAGPRGADAERANVRRIERRRAWAPAMMAAAACIAALFGTRGRFVDARSIVAEEDAGALLRHEPWPISWTPVDEACDRLADESHRTTCTLERYVFASADDQARACVAPPASFENVSLSLACESEIACRLGTP